jgi:hypothetical protein
MDNSMPDKSDETQYKLKEIQYYQFLRGDEIMDYRVEGMKDSDPDLKIGMGVPSRSPHIRGMINMLTGVYGDQELVGAEIGVLQGLNAVSILSNLNMRKLYLVDPYMPYLGGHYGNSSNNTILANAVNNPRLKIVSL